eukprot:6193452-Pleurochrysis_carterae.AAC.2
MLINRYARHVPYSRGADLQVRLRATANEPEPFTCQTHASTLVRTLSSSEIMPVLPHSPRGH